MAAADHQDTFIVLQRKMQDMILRLARLYRVACYRCLPRQLADAAIVPLSAGSQAGWNAATEGVPRRWRSLEHDLAAFSAALTHQPHGLDAHRPVYRLAHVIDG